MIRTDRKAIHYSENLISKVLGFNNTDAWTIPTGTGSAATTTEQSFAVTRSLKLINTAPAANVIASNTTQSTIIPETGTYGFMCYLYKDVTETLTGLVKIFQNAVLLSDEAFSMDITDDNGKWVRYATTTNLSLTKGDDITFQVQLDGMTTIEASLTMYFDGFMIYAKDRGQEAPPFYTKPFDSTAVTVSHPIIIPFTFPENAKTSQDSLHGGFRQTGSQSGIILSSIQTITDTIGISKVFLLVNAGSDLAGDITITGISVNRETGAETGADTDVIPITALSTDSSTTDANGNPVRSITGGYISSKWFKGAITLSTTDVSLTDIDVYQVAFDQFNDSTDITVDTLDATYLTENTTCELDCYLYAVEVSGSVCGITLLATLTHETGQSINFYRKRIGNIAKALDGTYEGIFVDLYLLPSSQTYFNSFVVNVWATKTETLDIN